jgi:hypothetical protein
LPGGCVPFHRRAETPVEVGFARGDHAEFERAAAFLALAHRFALDTGRSTILRCLVVERRGQVTD